MHYRQSLSMPECQATVSLRMIQAVVHPKAWLQKAAKWGTFLGASCCLACHPQNGGEDGESRQKPRGLKKGVPPFQHVSLLEFDFQYGHVGV